jgi:hypothetical protein
MIVKYEKHNSGDKEQMRIFLEKGSAIRYADGTIELIL